MKLAEWISALEQIKLDGVKIVHVSALESLSKQSAKSLSVSLWRLEKLGLISRITRGWVCIGDHEIWEVVKTVFPSAYLSLEWALHYYELIDQEVHVITLVWLGKPKTIKGRIYTFEFHKIKRNLYFGFDDRMVAEPEKALLDTIYFRNITPHELNLELLNVDKLTSYAERYPQRVRKKVYELIKQST
jgi:predicted transcriptional regulator of viral defense system